MKEKTLNVPNILTVIRLVLIPVVVVLMAEGELIIAFVFFLAACLTDLLDGYIARHYNQITKLGMWLDPLADKLMAVSVLITFTVTGVIPLFVVVIIGIKELLMLLGGALLLKKGIVVPSNKYGKIAAFLLNIAIAAAFFHEYWAPFDL